MTTFEEFSALELERGADEVLMREWAAGHTMPVHEHPFDTCALVVRGVPHAERYGAEGATFWRRGEIEKPEGPQ